MQPDTPELPHISVLLTENELASQFVEAVGQGRLPEKFFYWSPLSVKAWLELCGEGEYRNFVRSRSLVAGSASELASLTPEGAVEVLSLGAGQGDKDLVLLEAMRAAGRRVSYFPADASQALLEIACETALGAGFAVHGLKADFARPDHLKAMAVLAGDAPRLVMMLGNTLGAEDPLGAAEGLSAVLRPGDLLLVDGELYSSGTIAGYDNPLNRRFAWAPLHFMGLSEQDGDVVFKDEIDERAPGLHLVSKHFKAARPAEAFAGGENLKVDAGEIIDMNHSYKYSEEAFEEVLRRAGLKPVWTGKSDDGQFVMTLASLS